MAEETNWLYTDTVKEHFFNPRNVLSGDENDYQADGVGYVGNPACGDMMKMWIKVDRAQDRIIECKWKTFGCASAIGSTSMLSVMVSENGGMKIDDALKIKPEDIIDKLGGLPSKKLHCSVLGDKALRAAIFDYFKKSGQEDRMESSKSRVVCECLNVSELDIQEAILDGADNFEKLQEHTKVSTGCGKCKPEVLKLLKKYLPDD